MANMSLLSTTTRVEVPYIVVTIGEYTFGLFNRTTTSIEVNGKAYSAVKVTYPNYVKSLSINKVNGALNNYTLVIDYPIVAGSDPNLIDRILSTVSSSRKIVFTYGDCALPSFSYKDEEAIITNVSSNIDVNNSKITYSISAVSGSLNANAGKFNFPRYRNKKPSDIIFEMISKNVYGLKEIFYGMNDIEKVKQLGLICRDDKAVTIEAQSSITPFEYLNYLVRCMSPERDLHNSIRKSATYVLTVCDDVSDVLSGPYFKVSKLEASVSSKTSVDIYSIDIGYPGKNLVSSFRINDQQSYSILYNYSKEVKQPAYVYRIGDNGEYQEIESPNIANSSYYHEATEESKNWWSRVTQYPITAEVTIKGLLRAALLMTYVRLNVLFYGRKHNSSGVYMITKQHDIVDSSGYKTTLTLVRVQEDSGENDYTS